MAWSRSRGHCFWRGGERWWGSSKVAGMGGCGVKCEVFRVQGSGFRVQGSGFRVQSSEFRVQSSEFRREARKCNTCTHMGAKKARNVKEVVSRFFWVRREGEAEEVWP